MPTDRRPHPPRSIALAVAGLALAAAVTLSPAVRASPAPLDLRVDRSFGKVAGWSIGYSENLGGCLAAASFADETTIWFGLNGTRKTSYLALTNPKWKSIDVGGQYGIRLTTRGRGRWQGTFTGFEREGAKGLFQAGLKEGFVADLSNAGAVAIEFEGRQIATLSLVGSTDAFEAVIGCQRDAPTIKAKVETPGEAARPRELEPGMMSTGTGFFVSERGHVLTNHHVVEKCSTYVVRRPGYAPLDARFVASDAMNDLAVLGTDTPQKTLPPLSVRARIGESIYVFGFPQSNVLASTGNFTIGNVTATAGMRDDTRMLQISAPIHMGNSGGPVLDQFGNVVGVIRSKATALASNDIPQNVNFAIKTTIALNFLEANGIEPPINVRTSEPMDGATLAEKAKEFTVQVACR